MNVTTHRMIVIPSDQDIRLDTTVPWTSTRLAQVTRSHSVHRFSTPLHPSFGQQHCHSSQRTGPQLGTEQEKEAFVGQLQQQGTQALPLTQTPCLANPCELLKNLLKLCLQEVRGQTRQRLSRLVPSYSQINICTVNILQLPSSRMKRSGV